MIWARASPLRPRVIQLFFEPKTKTWHAYGDSCGGLPPTIHVSQEARKVVLKGYTSAFDTWVDLEEDTIFICDPVFTIRKPLRGFLNTEHAKRLRKISIASDVYNGLERSATKFPTLCPHPAAVLRKLEALTHFTLAVSEDGESGIYDDTTDSSEDEQDITDWDDSSLDNEVENIDIGLGRSQPENAHLSSSAASTGADPQVAQQLELRRHLAALEKEALANLSRGYVRPRGNIHFESAMESVEHWDDWDLYRALIIQHYGFEKASHPDWIRPKVSIMVLKYGLNQLGDYGGPVHIPGDHRVRDSDLEDSEYPPEDSEWEEYAWDANENLIYEEPL